MGTNIPSIQVRPDQFWIIGGNHLKPHKKKSFQQAAISNQIIYEFIYGETDIRLKLCYKEIRTSVVVAKRVKEFTLGIIDHDGKWIYRVYYKWNIKCRQRRYLSINANLGCSIKSNSTEQWNIVVTKISVGLLSLNVWLVERKTSFQYKLLSSQSICKYKPTIKMDTRKV